MAIRPRRSKPRALRALHEMAYRLKVHLSLAIDMFPSAMMMNRYFPFVNSGDLVNPNPRGSTPTNRSVQVSVG